MTTPGTIKNRVPVTGVNDSRFQVSVNFINDSLVLDGAAPDGAVLVRDSSQPDGWGWSVPLGTVVNLRPSADLIIPAGHGLIVPFALYMEAGAVIDIGLNAVLEVS